jgi:hypothetical protein
MQRLKTSIRYLQKQKRGEKGEIYTERQRYLQNKELGLEKADPTVELGPEKLRFKVVEELYI